MAGTAAIISAVAAVGGAAAQADSARRASNQARDAANAGAAAADPAASLRPFFQDQILSRWGQLSTTNPNEIMQDPSFQFLQQQGLQGIANGNTAQFGSGPKRNGTFYEDMSRFNQGLASTYIDNQFKRNMSLMGNLGAFSGLTTGSPGTAGQVLGSTTPAQMGYNMNDQTYQQIGGAINSIGRLNWGGAGTGTPNTSGSIGGIPIGQPGA